MSSKNGLDHQDWETYIIHCKSNPINKNKETKDVKKKTIVNPEIKMDAQIEDGKLKHKKINNLLKEDFKKWRNLKGLTQKDVANKLAVQTTIINKFENGQLNHDPKLVGKIKRLIKN